VLLLGPLLGRAEGKKLRLLAVRLGAERLGPMVALCQAGTIATVIDRRYRLCEVPEALRYLGEGHAKGKLVAILE
jgi:NADPH:quinone reductase-like Zn-dependent oxidoreductase